MTISNLHLDPNASLKSQINDCNSLEQLNEILLDTLRFVAKNIHNQEEFEFIFFTLEKCIHFFKMDPEKYKKEYLGALNDLGILCYYNHNYDASINFYFIALLRSNIEDYNRFYHNIADSLVRCSYFDIANFYFNKAIENINAFKSHNLYIDERLFVLNLYLLNYTDCLIKAGQIERANELFKTVGGKDKLPVRYKSFYLLIETYLSFYTSEKKVFLEKVKELKSIYLKDKVYSIVLEINDFLIEKLVITNSSEKAKLLEENLDLSSKINNKDVERKAIVKTIEFYDNEGDQKKKIYYLEELYKLDSSKKVDINAKLIDIYLREVSDFFHELKHINKTISEQKQELEEITYILSHDLKTPLRTINSFSELIQRNIEKENYSSLNQHLAFIRNSSENLYHLIEDVNVLHTIEKNEEEHTAVDLNEITKTVIVNLDDFIKKENAQILIENNLPTIQGIRSQFSIFFQNIIENGLKYNKSEKPTVKITSKIIDNQIHIIFSDNGIGIDNEYFDQIFLFFKRLHLKGQYEGSGFGLGICNKIASKFNGKIEVNSEIGKGSVFTFILPITLLSQELTVN